MELLNKESEVLSDCGANPRNSPKTLREEPRDDEHQCGIVHQDSCDVASVVFSMSEEKRESIQQESTSIIMSSDDPLPSQDDQTSTCETSNYVGIADGRGANTLPQHMRTPLCDCTGSSGYEGDYYTTAEICDSSNLSVRSNSVELRRSGDLPSLCPTPNLDRGRIFVDATPPTTTHDTTGSSGYGSDYISATELISDEACRRQDLPSLCPAPNLDFLDATPPTTTHDTTGSSGYGSDYISTTELIRNDTLCNICYSQLHSNEDKADLTLPFPFHGLDDHLCTETKDGSFSSYISVEVLHEGRREQKGDAMDAYSQAEFFNMTQDMTGSSGYGSDYVTAEELNEPLAIKTRQSEHATPQVPMATSYYRELAIIREDYITEAELFQNC